MLQRRERKQDGIYVLIETYWNVNVVEKNQHGG